MNWERLRKFETAGRCEAVCSRVDELINEAFEIECLNMNMIMRIPVKKVDYRV